MEHNGGDHPLKGLFNAEEYTTDELEKLVTKHVLENARGIKPQITHQHIGLSSFYSFVKSELTQQEKINLIRNLPLNLQDAVKYVNSKLEPKDHLFDLNKYP